MSLSLAVTRPPHRVELDGYVSGLMKVREEPDIEQTTDAEVELLEAN